MTVNSVCVCVSSLNTGVSVTTWMAADHVTATSEAPSTISEFSIKSHLLRRELNQQFYFVVMFVFPVCVQV